MKIVKEVPLKDFEFWSGAVDNAKLLTDEEMETVEEHLEELAYCNGKNYTETDINDLFWFEFDSYIVELILGLDPEEVEKRRE